MIFSPEQKDTKICYRINDSVDFIPADHMLRSCVSQHEVIMFGPAANCLAKLIEVQGNVVGQRELISVGWPGGEEKVSLNAFYQSVSHIRKQLSDFMPDQEVITTVKRSGLLISKNVRIQKLPCGIEEVEESSSVESIMSAVGVISDQSTNRGRYKPRVFLAIFMPILLMIGAYVYFDYSLKQTPPSLFTNYVFYKKLTSGCEMYINIDEIRDLTKNVLYDPNTFDCQGYSRAYITEWAMHPRSSVALCRDVNLGKGNVLQCKTFYYASNYR